MHFQESHLNVLIAEDDDDDMLLIRELLRDGFHGSTISVETVDTCDKAVKCLDEFKFHVCLFDYRLGEVSGIELLRIFRSRNVGVPIILLTGQGDQEVAVEAMKAGATDYLVKANLSVESLTHSIRHAIKLHDEEEQRKRAEEALRKQDSLLQGLAESSSRLLTIHDHVVAVNESLSVLGETIGVDFVCIFQHGVNPERKETIVSRRFSWVKEAGNYKTGAFNDLKYSDIGDPAWFDIMSTGGVVSALVRDLPSLYGEFPKSQGIRSLILVPIIIDESYWGFMGLADCQSERHWTKSEEAILKAIATNFGGKLKNERDSLAFRSIVEGTSSRTGDEFFRCLVRHLALALGVRFAYISEFLDFANQCNILAGWGGDKFSSLEQYSPVDTPCEEVLAGMVSYYSDGVQEAFPNDSVLVDLKIRSYMGVPFFDSSQKIIGHLMVMDDKIMGDKERTLSVLKIFASRAGAELERKRAEDTIKKMAYHDALTGLPNRVLLHDRLQLAVAQVARNKRMLAVMYLDFDRFKIINDTLGHAVGDLLLQEVAHRLKICLREGDTVARLGGDEFTILQPEIKSKDDVSKLAQKLLEVVRQPILINEHELNITLSIGIAIYPVDGEDIKTLLKNADDALYAAKDRGRDNYQIFSDINASKIVQSSA
jgi:diguanylate cyclase (GGDEF)-like protein